MAFVYTKNWTKERICNAGKWNEVKKQLKEERCPHFKTQTSENSERIPATERKTLLNQQREDHLHVNERETAWQFSAFYMKDQMELILENVIELQKTRNKNDSLE